MAFQPLSRTKRSQSRSLGQILALILLLLTTYDFGNPVCFSQDSAPDLAIKNVREAISEKISAREKIADQIQSAFGVGRLQYRLKEPNADEVILLDAGLQVFVKGEKYRVHLIYDTKLDDNADKQDQLDGEPRWVESEIIERVIIFDGEKIFSIATNEKGECSGIIYFGFAKMAVMRMAGYPFEDPIQIWRQAISLEGLDLSRTSISPFQNKGLLATMQKNTYRMRFFFLDDFSYDLRRVSSFRASESRPFRDYSLHWEMSNGIPYVHRFVNTTMSAHGNTASREQTTKRTTVEFSRFEYNSEISDLVFQLESVAIPDGSRFVDKRSAVEGGPQELVYENRRLQSLR